MSNGICEVSRKSEGGAARARGDRSKAMRAVEEKRMMTGIGRC